MMLGHYCLFLTVVNKWVGFYVCILFAKLKGIKTGHVGNRLDGAPALLLTWLWTKYQCHYPLELSIHAFALLILPIGHFYNLIGQPAIFLPYKFHLYQFLFYPIIGTFNFKDGEQWTATIMIFDMVLLVIRTFCSLYSTGMLETAFPLMISIMCGFSLLSSCKCYLERFVGLSKI